MVDRRLQALHAVAKYLSFTKAAETLLDDAALMQFGFRFLRQVLFGENTIAVHELNIEQRRQRVAERLQQLEREAAERMAREEDPPDVDL